MRLILPSTILPLTAVRPGPPHLLCIGAAVGCELGEPSTLMTNQAAGQLLGQSPDQQPIDAAQAKPYGEVLVVGEAQAPGGEPVSEMTVGVRVGALTKTVRVVGDRYWWWDKAAARWTPTAPTPFTRMPLSWDRAYGGPDFKQNPIGRGHKAAQAVRDGQAVALPNLEDPRQPITAPEDVRYPAGLWALDITWHDRACKAGSYDEAWSQDRFPALPLDADLSLFNAAPQDQWVDGRFRGDEPVDLRGLSAAHPARTGRLPGLLARAFVRRHASDTLQEIAMGLETLVLFGSTGQALLIWRGTVEVADSDAADVAECMLALERLGEPPLPLEHYREVHRLRTDPDERGLHALNDRQLMPPLSAEELASEAAEEEALRAERNAKHHAFVDDILSEIAAAGDANAAMQEAGMDPGPVTQAFQDLKATAAKHKVDLPDGLPADLTATPVQQAMADQAAQLRKDMAPVLAALDQMPVITPERLAKGQVDLAAVVKQADAVGAAVDALPGADLPAPSLDPPMDLDQINDAVAAAGDQRAQVENALAGLQQEAAKHGQDIPGITADAAARDEATRKSLYDRVFGPVDDASTPDPEQLAQMSDDAFLAQSPLGPVADTARLEALLDQDRLTSEAGRAEVQTELDALIADIQATLPDGDAAAAVAPGPMTPDLALYLGQLVAQAARDGHSLAGRDLHGGNFSGAALAGVDLSGVNLANAKLNGADLTGANLTGALLYQADLTGAILTGAILQDVQAIETVLTEARADQADWRNATLYQCHGASAALNRADLSGATLNDCDLTRIQAEKLTLRESFLHDCRLSGGDLSGAAGAGATLVSCDLTDAILEGADLSGANLLQCQAGNCRAAGATLAWTVFADLQADGLIASGARAEGIKVVGQSSLRGARLDRLHAENSAWRGCDLTGANLALARLSASDLGETRLGEAQLERACLRNAILANADCTGAQARGADFFQALMRKVDLRNSDLTEAMLYAANTGEARWRDARLDGAETHLTRQDKERADDA